mgnify:CR=1 FL=1
MADEDDGDALRVAVTDTGKGIASDDLPRLFTPFTLLTGLLSVAMLVLHGAGQEDAERASFAAGAADVIRVVTAAEFTDAVKVAKASDRTTVIYVETDPMIYAPDSHSWWDVPVSEVSTLESTQQAYARYVDWKKVQRPLINPSDR